MAVGKFINLLGTTLSKLKIGGTTGVTLKNNSANLIVRNADDSADAEMTASKVKVSGNALELNSDAAGSGSDYKLTLQRAASGMSGDVTLTFPPDDGTAGQVLQTDGSGNLTWVAAGSTAMADKLDTTSLAFGSTSPVAMFTTGASDVIDYIEVIIDTPFDHGTMSVGIAGTTSKYVSSTDVDLTAEAGTIFDLSRGLDAQGAENLIITYAAGGATVGAARVIVHYATPA